VSTDVMVTVETLGPDHFDAAASWLGDPAVNRWLTSEWRNRDVTSVVVAMAVRNKRNRLWVIRYHGSVCGIVGLADIDIADRTAMIWYLLGDHSLSGQGITTQAVRAVARLVLDEGQCCSLYAWIMEDNIASRRVLEKSGFREAGRIRRAACSDGQQVDRIYFDLTVP
jgi:RimJ/RimL family protein N-acetyltransferase